ncbi:bifunctional diaminohydroxyphosphoribosylaminopyrimidine deaminase/5-amino-6-(5-phosphoribosylamino)uracil reductase RibD [Oceanidesulfovibrio marinus]|uniref:Riboflavin biosynthesis protein RibD n=1 Tax=Oceanidesulfovibrio marinus TaxID=370038 RepID=A0A6P1ZGF7_9BACT|nr:bifunctional diaminohydroxyphosphoribosylaminopyrimidine deaminase/5-amino-6-(5-phosphoribosylamino)uracil reductase RibD [Oceanidesulfovibrio marinus]TVM32547.1 bifunctional diaminohydroxyphosphoribosylaminopyrimidine deaminase/5-amino-6-(5-phosphoribosylamino)uracil reductase RibD [Oceanidesulfovibrio marinus]
MDQRLHFPALGALYPPDPALPAGERACFAAALTEAERGRFATAPNPCVGAVLATRDGILARGYHAAPGQPHAEVMCLRDARDKGVDPASATLFVTLEPCNHTGRTPPCTRAILDAGVRSVVVGHPDPNPLVAGGGLAFLRENGVNARYSRDPDVRQACADSLADFLVWVGGDLPYVILKLATTLDGRIATRTGHSQWITGPDARREVHQLRRGVGAVLVGGNTFREDDPQLTHRLAEGGAPLDETADDAHPLKQPLAVVATSRLPEPGAVCRLLSERPHQTVFIAPPAAAESDQAKALVQCGARIIAAKDMAEGLRALRRELGVHHVLCEGGGGLGLSLLEAGLVHELRLHMAPKLLGDAEARPLFAGRAPERMDEALGMRLTETRTAGQDLLLTFRPQDS